MLYKENFVQTILRTKRLTRVWRCVDTIDYTLKIWLVYQLSIWSKNIQNKETVVKVNLHLIRRQTANIYTNLKSLQIFQNPKTETSFLWQDIIKTLLLINQPGNLPGQPTSCGTQFGDFMGAQTPSIKYFLCSPLACTILAAKNNKQLIN